MRYFLRSFLLFPTHAESPLASFSSHSFSPSSFPSPYPSLFPSPLPFSPSPPCQEEEEQLLALPSAGGTAQQRAVQEARRQAVRQEEAQLLVGRAALQERVKEQGTVERGGGRGEKGQ